MSPKLAGGLVVGALVAAVAIGLSGAAKSPCRARPHGVAIEKCQRVCAMGPSGKIMEPPCASGDDVVMQKGQWIDNGGCVEVACSVMFR